MSLGGLTQPASAWDGHARLTQATLEGFETKNPKLWAALQQPVLVTPIEDFLGKAFGRDTTFEKARSKVFGGLGVGYKVLYVEGAGYRLVTNWATGLNRQIILPHPIDDEPNSQAIGKWVKPTDVLAIYSDEPDWGMDDDVPELRGKGLSKNVEGTANRVLRHFWYEGEAHFGVSFGTDQETDKRMQLYYELALTAFAVGEPYWGYRFLANSLHYLQDIVQPFHSKAIINDDMLDNVAVVHGVLCDRRRKTERNIPPEVCGPRDTVADALILNGWIVGAYHGLFEDFARGLVSEGRYLSARYLVDADGKFEHEYSVETLKWTKKRRSNLLDMTEALRSAQQAIVELAPAVGKDTMATFGPRYKIDAEHAVLEHLAKAGTDETLAYRMTRLKPGVDDDIKLTQAQQKGYTSLVSETHGLFVRAGAWGRRVIELVLTK